VFVLAELYEHGRDHHEECVNPYRGPGRVPRLESTVTPVVTEKYRPFVATSMTDLHVTVDGRDLEAVWTDDAPETRVALEDALPAAGEATRWGDELYFDLALDVPLENASAVVPEGSIAYWPAGGKLCLFWGPTPASEDSEPAPPRP